MTPSNLGPVTGLQLDVLRVLWDQPEATVMDVHAALSEQRGLATTTIATLLKRFENRGLVSFFKDGRLFRYTAEIEESEVLQATVDDVTEQVFAGDVAAFVAQLISRKDVNARDLAKIRRLIKARERELGK